MIPVSGAAVDFWGPPPTLDIFCAIVAHRVAERIGVDLRSDAPPLPGRLCFLPLHDVAYTTLRGGGTGLLQGVLHTPEFVTAICASTPRSLPVTGRVSSHWFRIGSEAPPLYAMPRTPKLYLSVDASDPASCLVDHVPEIVERLCAIGPPIGFSVKMPTTPEGDVDQVVIHFSDPASSNLVLRSVVETGIPLRSRIGLGRLDFGFDTMQQSDSEIVAARIAKKIMPDGVPAPAVVEAVRKRDLVELVAIASGIFRGETVHRHAEVQEVIGRSALHEESLREINQDGVRPAF